VSVNNEWRLQKAKAESMTFCTISTAGHVQEKEDGNPYLPLGFLHRTRAG